MVAGLTEDALDMNLELLEHMEAACWCEQDARIAIMEHQSDFIQKHCEPDSPIENALAEMQNGWHAKDLLLTEVFALATTALGSEALGAEFAFGGINNLSDEPDQAGGTRKRTRKQASGRKRSTKKKVTKMYSIAHRRRSGSKKSGGGMTGGWSMKGLGEKVKGWGAAIKQKAKNAKEWYDGLGPLGKALVWAGGAAAVGTALFLAVGAWPVTLGAAAGAVVTGVAVAANFLIMTPVVSGATIAVLGALGGGWAYIRHKKKLAGKSYDEAVEDLRKAQEVLDQLQKAQDAKVSAEINMQTLMREGVKSGEIPAEMVKELMPDAGAMLAESATVRDSAPPLAPAEDAPAASGEGVFPPIRQQRSGPNLNQPARYMQSRGGAKRPASKAKPAARKTSAKKTTKKT